MTLLDQSRHACCMRRSHRRPVEIDVPAPAVDGGYAGEGRVERIEGGPDVAFHRHCTEDRILNRARRLEVVTAGGGHFDTADRGVVGDPQVVPRDPDRSRGRYGHDSGQLGRGRPDSCSRRLAPPPNLEASRG